MSALRMDVTTRFSKWQELLKQGMTGQPTKDCRENSSAIKIKEIDARQRVVYVIKRVLT
jgi:hypothetical protein